MGAGFKISSSFSIAVTHHRGVQYSPPLFHLETLEVVISVSFLRDSSIQLVHTHDFNRRRHG